MKILLIYPTWTKISEQTPFNLPPHGPVVFAAALPEDVDVTFIDENVDDIIFSTDYDLIAISVMLTSQVKRAWKISDEFRALGMKVILGGIGVMLHSEECQAHADAIFLGESEVHINQLLSDFKSGRLQKVYNFHGDFPDTSGIRPARRDILNKEKYYHKGIQLVDLFHASRGCRFNCYPCAVSYLGGRQFRPRPMDKIAEELSTIENNRLFVVDNSLAQDKQWEKDLFRTMIPFKKSFCSHTIDDDPEILALAAEAGAWYVYQAVFDTSDYIRDRIKRYHDFGIGVEGTILLGMDNQTEDDILRLIDFLLEIDLDLAEFTVFTPFPHTKGWDDMVRQNRIIDTDWDHYNAANVVYQPKHMSPGRLQELYHHAWDSFYAAESQSIKMYRLIQNVSDRERKNGTFQPRVRDAAPGSIKR